ncbi:MAG: AMP-binding protein, partial [Eggerthellaceae bacterium]|nr:AMP-binding protein [Eggerthellaceae bacterium]
MHNEYLEPLWEAFETYAEYPAVVDRGAARATSYREFGQLVCRVVAWLDARGVLDHSFIPIILPSSAEYLAAEIGAWMAGHTAVPMGPAFPPERIAYICEHCEAPLVIDEEAWEEIAATEPAQFAGGVPDYPEEELPALLIYTSGSTGNPKGILHSFKGLATKHTAKVGLTYSPDEVWGMGAPLYFVASLTCFKVLKEGGQLHLYDPDTYRDMRKLEDYIAEHGVTFTFLSPAMLSNFNNRSDTLKVVFTGSERLTGQCSRDGYKLLNCYGMSETGGTVCAFEVKRPYDTTPVGKPEEEWCLLGDDGKPVAPGEEGEFCLHGVYCDDYYKDPERTAELYRDGWLHTGDLLRALPDGNLVYVNRKDWMAKINGQRVEPGEVENAIRKLDGVNQAVVKAFDNDTGSQYLCAFFTGDADADGLRDELARTLPPYMVPSFFVPVREFALLPNGKVNRKALAAPDAASLRNDYVAPETPVQAALCDAYAELFGLERAGIDDDFFLLGGDSIRVMKLQQMCEELPLTTKLISRERTPRKIAAAVEGGSARAPEAAADSASTQTPAPTPLTQTQLGIYVESVSRAGEAVYNNPVLLKLDPAIDADRLARALEAAVEAHSFVKLHIEEDAEGTPLMVPGDAPYAQRVERFDAEAFEALKPKLIEPFDLHAGPLFRIRVLQTPDDLYLFTDFHHIIYDGTSMRILMADVDRAYAGEALEPERYTGFDIAREEAAARATSAYDEAKAYYEETFDGLDIDSTPLPDRAESEIDYATIEVPIGLNADELARFCARHGITANVFALAAFGRLLGAYAGMTEALFATIYNGRADLACARTVSMMVKTLPVHCTWDASTTVADFLQALKSQVMASMANDLYSFAEVATLADVSSDVLFAYQGDYLALGTVCGGLYQRVALDSNATGSALDFQLFTGADGLFLRVEYQRNRYSDAYVADMAASYGCIARGLLANERVSDIELVSDAQAAALDAFNDTEVPYDQSQTVVSLFRSAAAAYPDNLAAVCEGEQLTYRELDELTERLAAYVAGLGLGAGDVVSVLVPRGLWMPVASLGALKAGCAYQPLDPTYPPERLNFMVGDASAKLLVTTEELHPLITDYDGEVLIVSDPRALRALGDCAPDG